MNRLKTYWITLALKGLLLTAGFGTYTGIRANHVLGGEISYVNQGGNKYKFALKLYRNCNECEFNSGNCADVKALDIYASPEVLNYSLKLGTIPLTKISKRDVTPLCKTSKSPCTGGNYPAGIEEWLFEGFVNFDTINPDYCKYEIAIRVESRKDVYNQSVSEAFYNYTRLNICSGLRNNSPVFESPVYYLLPYNQSFTYNILAKDSDGDSLSYELVNANKAWNTSISYPGGYSGQKPLDVYCPAGNCNLDRTKWPVEGIDIDPYSGWLGFTPVKNGQFSNLVIQVTEWRKSGNSWVTVGVSRRDVQVEVITPANNSPKITSSALSYFACAGQTFMLDFSVLDNVFSGMKDSVCLQVYSDLPDFNFSKVSGSAKNQFDAYYTVPVKQAQIRSKPYYVTIVATDDNCPLTLRNFLTLEIIVTGAPLNTSVIEYTRCDRISFKTDYKGQALSHTWFLTDSKGMLDSRIGLSGEFRVPSPGKYYIIHQVSNSITGCTTEEKDSLVVPMFIQLKENMKWTDTVCADVPLNLEASFTGGTMPFFYEWNNTVNTRFNNISLSKDSLISVKIWDAKGCILDYSKTIRVYEKAKITVSDTAMCLPATQTLVNLSNRVSIAGNANFPGLSLQYLNNSGILSKINNRYFFEPFTEFQNQFTFDYTDHNQCVYKGTFNVNVVDPVPTGIVKPASLCSNSESIDLDKATGVKLSGGVWSCFPKPEAMNNNWFNPAVSGAGNFNLYYLKNYQGCLLLDTTLIRINEAPLVTIDKPGSGVLCENSVPVELKGNPSGGIWTNDAMLSGGNVFSPAELISKNLNNVVFRYRYINPQNGCSNIAEIPFIVNKSPKIDWNSNLEICEYQKLQLQPNPRYTEFLELAGESKNIKINRLGADYFLEFPDIVNKETRSFFWKVKALPGCSDIVQEFKITIKPRPDISFSASPVTACVPFSSYLKIDNINTTVHSTRYFWREGLDWVEGNPFKSAGIANPGPHPFTVKALSDGCYSYESLVNINALVTPKTDFVTLPVNRIVSADYSFVEFYDKTECRIPYSLFWEFEHGTPPTSTKNKVGVDFPRDTGLYNVKLTATSSEGCTGSKSFNIRVRPGLQFYAPNIFTPDGKGPNQNETFGITMDSTISFHLTVRNRWGEIVFITDRADRFWDGNYLNRQAPPGVYIWELEANTIYGIYVRKAGAVSLIR